MKPLDGKRILLVEDEFLVAATAEDFLAQLGAVVIGPAYRMRDGFDFASREVLDAAVLDVNINGERSDVIAEALAARSIPFVIATGYGEGEKKRYGMRVLDKPYNREKLATALLLAMGEG